jgi:hypothetical protein
MRCGAATITRQPAAVSLLDVSVTFDSDARLFADDPQLGPAASTDVRAAIMGDILRSEDEAVEFTVEALASAPPIERLEMCPARRRPRLPSGLYGSSRRLPNAPSKRSTPITARKIAVATLIETPAKGCCPLKSICRKSEKHSRLSATTTLLKKGRSDWPERTCRKSHGLFALVKRGR